MNVLRVESVERRFRRRDRSSRRGRAKEVVHAVRGVSFSVEAGETVGIVGESGAGKSTLARCIVGLERPDAGKVFVRDTEATALTGRAFRLMRRDVQMVFQDSYASLNPRRTVGELIEEPLRLMTKASQEERRNAVDAILQEVELAPEIVMRYRHELSGGQQQRVNLARALVVHPGLVILDEPVSALDASVRGSVLQLLKRLRADLGLTYVMIGHDLSVVRDISTRVLIMYEGQVLEDGPVGTIFQDPIHPYTRTLLASALVPGPDSERARTNSTVHETPSVTWRTDEPWRPAPMGGTSRFPDLIHVGGRHYVAMHRAFA